MTKSHNLGTQSISLTCHDHGMRAAFALSFWLHRPGKSAIIKIAFRWPEAFALASTGGKTAVVFGGAGFIGKTQWFVAT